MSAGENNAPALVVKLQGGIGNQLFQHALGEYCREMTSCRIMYTADSFSLDPYRRKNVMERIDPDIAIVSINDLGLSNTRILSEDVLVEELSPQNLEKMLLDQSISFCILNGYWQSVRYIPNNYKEWLSRRLAKMFEASKEGDTDFLALIQAAKKPVAVHFRRHDYKHHGICTENYYIDTLRWLIASSPEITLFVFSDEPNYTSQFLNEARIPHTLVATKDDLQDLYAMTICSGHVIANSTFSWWGAFLASSSLTLYPKPWSFVHTPSENLFPAEWIPISNAVEKHVSNVSYFEQLARLNR